MFPPTKLMGSSVICSAVCLVIVFQGVYSEYIPDLKNEFLDVSAADDWNRTIGELIELMPGYNCTGDPMWPNGVEQIFPCQILPPSMSVPNSVHKLRPADINVIGAIGDSLSAANGGGACSMPQLLLQYRGKTFSHGGDESYETVPTLANVLRKYNPSLKGYGVETGPWFSANAGMNVAVPGSVAYEIEQQAENLVQKMKDDGSIDFVRDWKLITIFIGGNDLCEVCNDKTLYSASAYVSNVKKALQVLYDKMPRTLVNVVGILDLRQINEFAGFVCKMSHLGFCPCVSRASEDELDNEWTPTFVQYQKQLERMITSGIFDDKEDFTAVYQPFLHESKIPLINGSGDLSYMAPDCFHFSARGHAEAGKSLWNNMVQPVGSKATSWEPNGPFTCPTQDSPFLFTNVNSRQGATTEPVKTKPVIMVTDDDLTSGPIGAGSVSAASRLTVLLLVFLSVVCNR